MKNPDRHSQTGFPPMALSHLQNASERDWTALLEAARELENPCRCCPRQCGVNRARGERGFCGAATPARVTKAFITYGEEEFLNPAYMLYFSHCNLRCAYCSQAHAIQPDFAGGEPCRPAAVAADIDAAFAHGDITSLQILGGEPGCSLSAAIAVLAELKSAVPIVWNSNLCLTETALELVDACVDFHVADLKFGDQAECAETLCGFPSYWPTVTRNLRKITPERLLIRHLPLGGHIDCCTRKVVDFIRREMPRVPVSFHTLIPDPASRTRSLTGQEQRALDDMVKTAGLRRLYATLCDSPATGRRQSFVSEIVIRKDGAVLAQDLSEPVRNLLSNFNLRPPA